MKKFLVYKDKNAKVFKRMITSGSHLFDKYKNYAVAYLKYVNSDFDKNLSTELVKAPGLGNVELENIVPKKYKWVMKDINLRGFTLFMKELEERVSEFESKEDTLKMVIGICFLRFMLTCKLVDIYCATAALMVENGMVLEEIDFDTLGIGKSVMRYFDDFEVLGSKTIDEWLKYNCDGVELKFFQTALKRISAILVGDERGVE